MKTSTAIAKPMSDEVREQLDAAFPQEASALRIQLPRFGMVSQDITEETKNPKTGKKEITIVTEAGTFFTETQTEDLDENGKKLWEKTELGIEISEIIILYERKQLSFFSPDEGYTSSPIYDTADEEVRLFHKKKEVARGTPAELRALPQFQGKTAKGKPTSKLEENRVLFVQLDGVVYQWTVRGSSMYEFLGYKKATKPNQVITSLSSESREQGTTRWNATTFTSLRPLNADESVEVLTKIQDIQKAISIEKGSYAQTKAIKEGDDKDFDEAAEALGAPAKKGKKGF
jgi:hypothetical protein